ncbi:MAG: hypothetical protein AAGC71_09205 [Pseudomonadota bacterium]
MQHVILAVIGLALSAQTAMAATDATTDSPVDDVRVAVESALDALDIDVTNSDRMTIQGIVTGHGLAAGTTVIVSMTSVGKHTTQVVVETTEPEDRTVERFVLREILAFFEQE